MSGGKEEKEEGSRGWRALGSVLGPGEKGDPGKPVDPGSRPLEASDKCHCCEHPLQAQGMVLGLPSSGVSPLALMENPPGVPGCNLSGGSSLVSITVVREDTWADCAQPRPESPPGSAAPRQPG